MAKTYEQYPTEARLYGFKVAGDTIASTVWTITPPGPTVVQKSATGSETTAMVSGITGSNYALKVIITCTSGQVLERTASIRRR